MHGFLHVDKPTGMSSRRVVDQAQAAFPGAKVGHAGTLDPLAQGVLVLAVGQATRLIRYVQQMPKTYLATFLLGQTSDTDDLEGKVRLTQGARIPDQVRVQQALSRWVGQVQQVPPDYSAAKVRGRRAYALARAGRPVELRSRTVHIDRIDLVIYRYPELKVRVECGAGTYIRSLARDVGRQLQVGGLMAELIREAVGPFRLGTALSLDRLSAGDPPPLERMELAVGGLPVRRLTDQECAQIAAGVAVPAHQVQGPEIAGLDARGRLRAILVPRSAGKLGPVRNFQDVPTR